MWLINWIPGLLFIRFTDALCTRFVGDTVLRGANPVAKVNSLCSWSHTSKEERNGRVRWSHASPEKQSQANLGRSAAPFRGISPGRPVLKRFSLPSWAWRRGSYLGLLLRRNWEMSPNTKSHSRVNSGQCRAGVCPIRGHTSQALGRFVSHSICFWSLFVVCSFAARRKWCL